MSLNTCARISATVFSVLVVFGFGAYGRQSTAHKVIHSSDLTWIPIIKGCDLAPVSGDFNAEGEPFVIRIRCADHTKIPAHWHPTDENITVLKGTFLVGIGDSFEEAKLQTVNVGRNHDWARLRL
jgi:anti-sigma factor ChrR (cupin superfamily)